jgi:hypothetical protein
LNRQSADQIRNEQRGGAGAVPRADDGPEANATMRKAWSEPGGEAYSFRNAVAGSRTQDEDHGELTAAETPDTTRHLGDASLSDGAGKGSGTPPAGPHDKPELTNPDATPGAGTLNQPGRKKGDIDSTSG